MTIPKEEAYRLLDELVGEHARAAPGDITKDWFSPRSICELTPQAFACLARIASGEEYE